MKKTLKQFIYKEMEKGNYITDLQLAKFCGHEPNYYQAELYKQEYKRLQSAKDFFKEYEEHKDTTLHKYKNSYKWAKTRYYLENKTLLGENRSYKIPKIYYEYLTKKGIKTT